MVINPQIFREYDIRGIVGRDLTSEAATLIGKGFGTLLNRSQKKIITLGRDCRLSSEDLKSALVSGLLSTGCQVIDLGLIPTPLLYFSLHHFNPDGGIMITGSHNPPEYNGLKLCIGKWTLYGPEIQEIRQVIQKGDFVQGAGNVSEQDIIATYLAMLKTRIRLGRKLKVVVDAGNGMAGPIAPKIMRELGCQVEELYCNIDGHFPNHHPDPTIPQNLRELRVRVLETQADVGIAYDGDADRIGVIDNSGTIIWGDQLLVLFAREILSRKPASKIVFEVKCSQNLYEDIKKHGGIHIMGAAGHSLDKKRMREENAALGGEMSGHIFFADGYYGYDDAIFASCRLLQILANTESSLGHLLADLPKTYVTPEIRVDCPDDVKFKLVEELRDFFRNRYEIIDIDGVRILFDDGWALIRASNTQPVLVLRFEARSEPRLQEIKALIKSKLSQYKALTSLDF